MSSDGEVLLRARGLSKTFGAIHAVTDMSIEVAAGEVHALVGENGAGKSTLIGMLGGSVSPDSGELEVGGRLLPSLSPVLARELGVAVVYQELTLCPNMTVAENIFVGAPPVRGRILLDRKTMGVIARATLAELGGDFDPDLPVERTILANRQLTEIARALVRRANVLILDEPTSSLTHDDFRRLKNTIRRLRESGIGVIFVSHRLSEVLELSTRVTVMRDGRHVATLPTETTTERQLASLMVGRVGAMDIVENEYRQPRHAMGAPVLNVRNATRSPHFADVTIEVQSGEIVGIAGLRGSGRHELADCIYGLDRLDSGTVEIAGSPAPRRTSPRRSRSSGLTYVPLNRRSQGLIGVWDVKHNLALGNPAKAFKRALFSNTRLMRWVPSVLKQFNIAPPAPNMAVLKLSGGNQQKVVLARNVATLPKLLILLEPTRGVDVASKAEIRSLIRSAASDGVGVLLVDSELPELVGLCDRVYVMHRGQVTGELTRGELSEEAVTYLAAGGTAVASSDQGVALK